MASVPEALHQRKATGGSDEWITPPEVLDPLREMFNFTLDVAAAKGNSVSLVYINKQADALTVDWSTPGYVWCNPPYSLAAKFLAKGLVEARSGRARSVFLVNVATDTRVWQDVVLPHAVFIWFVDGRISFIAGEDIYKKDKETGQQVLSLRAGERGPSPHPSAIVGFGMLGREHDFPNFGTFRQRK